MQDVEDAKSFYSSVGKIFSHALNEYVHFNAEGFHHIVYKRGASQRDQNSQILRFKLLPRAIALIKLSTTHQEFETTLKEFEIKRYKKRKRITQPVTYWGIIAIIEGRKIKVILRRIGENGNVHFWSIIPDWVTNKYRDIKVFNTMKGNPEED